jgi:hypothetical protein
MQMNESCVRVGGWFSAGIGVAQNAERALDNTITLLRVTRSSIVREPTFPHHHGA